MEEQTFKEKEVFEVYLKKIKNFSGKFYIHRLKEIAKDYTLDNLHTLAAWYKDEKNKTVVGKILKKNNINLKKNIEKSIDEFEKTRATISPKPPTKESFEYLGMIHEH